MSSSRYNIIYNTIESLENDDGDRTFDNDKSAAFYIVSN